MAVRINVQELIQSQHGSCCVLLALHDLFKAVHTKIAAGEAAKTLILAVS